MRCAITAALAALRETHHLIPKDQEPVVWRYTSGEIYRRLRETTKPLPPVVLLKQDRWPEEQRNHWTETPLYALEKRHD
jgi:hypothetical protein